MGVTGDIMMAVEACYDAIFDSGRWPSALQHLADSLEVSSCVVRSCDTSHPLAPDRRGKTGPIVESTGHLEFTDLWLERIDGAPDPHLDRPYDLAKPAVCLIVEDEITTPDERKILPYYQEIARPGHREWWASIVFDVNGRNWCVPIFNDARRGPFDPRDTDCYLRIVPHFRRIIGAAEKLSDISAGAGLTALDGIHGAAVLLDNRGLVKRYNASAENLFGKGLAVRHSRIHAADRASDNRLQLLIGSEIGTSLEQPSCCEPAVIHRSGTPWLLAEVMPITSFGHDVFGAGELLLYFTELEIKAFPDEDLLRLTYHFTAAEARLATNLAAGTGIGAASSRLRISRETARTQLRAIFAKTGTRRQAELAALLTRLDSRSRH